MAIRCSRSQRKDGLGFDMKEGTWNACRNEEREMKNEMEGGLRA